VNDRGPRVNCDVLAPTSQLISGLNGPRIGSLDIVTPIGAPVPVVAARIFNDGGAGGTTGITLSAASSDSILEAGGHGVLFTPADTGRFRMNIGVRTGPSGAPTGSRAVQTSGTSKAPPSAS
jgi:hypothetical protein